MVKDAAHEFGLTVTGEQETGADPRGPANIFQHSDQANLACLTIYTDGSVHGDEIEENSPLGQTLGRLENEHPIE